MDFVTTKINRDENMYLLHDFKASLFTFKNGRFAIGQAVIFSGVILILSHKKLSSVLHEDVPDYN